MEICVDDIEAIEELTVDEYNVRVINSIEERYPLVRQDSKGPTFLCTYQGTWMGLHKTLGFPKDKAKEIERNYHELYKVSDAWVQAEIDKASERGYVELAFGTRLKTPLIHRSMRHRTGVLQEAKSEERTAGNALGQSYGLLNNRAANAFMERVWNSKYRLDIMPIGQIHDAIYLIWRDDLEVTKFVNDNLIDCMRWQELEAIKHDTVKLGAELCIFHPTWADEIKLPNDCSTDEILSTCTEALAVAA